MRAGRVERLWREGYDATTTTTTTIINSLTYQHAAAQIVKLNVPLVVRLSGNANEEGKKTLLEFASKNGFNIQVADNMAEGAKLAAAVVKSK